MTKKLIKEENGDWCLVEAKGESKTIKKVKLSTIPYDSRTNFLDASIKAQWEEAKNIFFSNGVEDNMYMYGRIFVFYVKNNKVIYSYGTKKAIVKHFPEMANKLR